MSDNENPFQDPSINQDSDSGPGWANDSPSWVSDSSPQPPPPPRSHSPNPSSNPPPPVSSPSWAEREEEDSAPNWANQSTPSSSSSSSTKVYQDNQFQSQHSQQPVVSSAPSLQELDPELKKYMLYMRITNMVTTVIMCLAAVLVLMGNPDASTAIISLYIFAFGLLICCFEISLKQVSVTIAQNFGMLYNAKGRIGFFFFIAILLFGMDIAGIVAGSLMVCNLTFNAYVIIKFPEYEQIQRQIHFDGVDDPENMARKKAADLATQSFTDAV